jgi:integrase
MNTNITVYQGSDQALIPGTLEDAITALADKWLATKAGRSGSVKTARAYRDALRSFRARLLVADLDLLMFTDNGKVNPPPSVALMAQAWAGEPGTGMHDGRAVTPATYNQKLAILSSFYHYAIQQGITGENPIVRVERRRVQGYAHAVAIEPGDLKRRLQQVTRTTLVGKRDYALLAVALQTGRRVSELAGLRWGDVQVIGNRVHLTWRRCKGGKVMHDLLAPAVSQALLDYLRAVYGEELARLPDDASVWVSVSPRNKWQAMGTQTIANICQKHLGTRKVHTLRHTFAHAMEQAGAKVSDIQARLGHESLATTGRYLAALSSAENAHAETLAAMFGIQSE